MQLSQSETRRAVWLQKRLKFLRWWNKVGLFLCLWRSSPIDQKEQWEAELNELYIKKFKLPDPVQSFNKTFGNPLNR